MATGWNHKYPYTNFHELNLDIWIQKMTDLETLVSTFDARITQNTNDITALKGRMTTAEADIANLKPRMTTAEGKIEDLEDAVSAIEGADIMDAVMLSSVGPANATANNVQITFVRDTYEDGVKDSPSGSQTTTIPAATEDAAGVMLPSEKEKLEAYTVDANGNVAFEGKVSAASPSGSGDLATKQYVDSVVVAGTATVTHVSEAASGSWNTAKVTPNMDPSDPSGVSADQWGSYTDLKIYRQFTFTSDMAAGGGQQITKIALDAAYMPSRSKEFMFVVQRKHNSTYDIVPIKAAIISGELRLLTAYGTTFTTGDVLYVDDIHLTYLM